MLTHRQSRVFEPRFKEAFLSMKQSGKSGANFSDCIKVDRDGAQAIVSVEEAIRDLDYQITVKTLICLVTVAARVKFNSIVLKIVRHCIGKKGTETSGAKKRRTRTRRCTSQVILSTIDLQQCPTGMIDR